MGTTGCTGATTCGPASSGYARGTTNGGCSGWDGKACNGGPPSAILVCY